MLALAFSGGKDSLACWYLFRHLNPLVLWVNSGKVYPETLEIINQVRSESNFMEIKTDQEGQIRREGLPSDVVPIEHTKFGQIFTGEKPVSVQSYLTCCNHNLIRPLMDKAKELGVTRLIRGERFEEDHKSPSSDGAIVEGIQFLHPIENWTTKEVFDYLKQRIGTLPAHFSIKHSSLDCYDCTAFVKQSRDRIEFTKKTHPLLYQKYAEKMGQLQSALKASLAPYEEDVCLT